MAYGKTKMGKGGKELPSFEGTPVKPGKPGKRKPVQPVRPEPKNEGRMYAGGDPNFNERTGEYKNGEYKNNKNKKLVGNNAETRNVAKAVQRKSNKVKKFTVSKPNPSIIQNPVMKRKPVQPKRPGGR